MEIEEIKRMASDKQNWRLRLEAVQLLKDMECQHLWDSIADLAINDPVFKVRNAACSVSQLFGITKNGKPIYLRENRKCDLIKFINKKLTKVRNSLNAGFTVEEYKEKFKVMYPEEYDVYDGNKEDHFDEWLSKIIPTLPRR